MRQKTGSGGMIHQLPTDASLLFVCLEARSRRVLIYHLPVLVLHSIFALPCPPLHIPSFKFTDFFSSIHCFLSLSMMWDLEPVAQQEETRPSVIEEGDEDDEEEDEVLENDQDGDGEEDEEVAEEEDDDEEEEEEEVDEIDAFGESDDIDTDEPTTNVAMTTTTTTTTESVEEVVRGEEHF